MTLQEVGVRLIEVLRIIQKESGYPDAEITQENCPVTDLIGFDSKMWPVSMGMLSEELGIDIPLDVNIYIAPDGKKKLTVAEISARVLALGTKGGKA